MTSQGILFTVAAFFALVGALGTVLAEKPLRAAMSLLMTVLSISALYLTLHAELLASIQMLVYAGAVVVLFVFVIMLIGSEGHASKPNPRVLAPIISSLLIGIFSLSMAAFVGRGTPWEPPIAPAGFGSVKGLGRAIFGDGVVPFEAVSITLLVAILAAIAVARGRTVDEVAIVKRDRTERIAGTTPTTAAGDNE
jgi:NADH-quinone oxidoreductase subunit J